MPSSRSLAHACALAFAVAGCSVATAVFASDPTGPLSAEPTVPRPSTKPCVVTLFAGAELVAHDDVAFAAPPGCPPPWSKIVLEGDLESIHRTNVVANLSVALTDIDTSGYWTLFLGAPQLDVGVPSWRVERDLTDYAALFRSTDELRVGLGFDMDNDAPTFDPDSVQGEVRLLFYPQGAAEPAPRVPDAVLDGRTQAYPRNIVKAYVEVLAQGLDEEYIGDTSDRFWFTCLPNTVLDAYPALRNQFAPGDDWGASLSSTPLGCDGGSFREVEAWLDDDTFLGIAPLYPWLPSNVHREFHDTIDTPVPSAQALNFIPYRLDITPFAAKLDDGVPHRIGLRMVGDTRPGGTHARLDAKVLVFLDPKRTIVTGALTRNTLRHARPLVSPVFSVASDTLTGTVDTRDGRKMDVEGYVNTSAGRVYSAVHTQVDFRDQQSLRVDGLVYPDYHRYVTLVALDTQVAQGSARVLGGTVLERNATVVQYPLRLAYGMQGNIEDFGDGYLEVPRLATVVADQTRFQLTDQWRDATHYQTALRDHFAGRHTRAFHYGSPSIDSDWSSQRDYVFLDTRGGCYTAALLTTSGALTGSASGAGCAGGVNVNPWYTRPDGSPDNMGWAP